jgi:antitoxin VapB
MGKKRKTEQELLEGLDAKGAHADELAELLPHELTPLERLKGSVKRYDRPTDPVWGEYVDSEKGVTDDIMEDRDQPTEGRE